MIDVVFVIMLFFMLMAGSIKVEKELGTKLPGTVDTSEPTTFSDEQIITISEQGEISLNDDVIDSAKSPDLPHLRSTLMRLKQTTDAAKSTVLITLISAPMSKYSRTINVLDALAEAKITSVTYTVADENQ
jgi:biopolymer transport protein ExbD